MRHEPRLDVHLWPTLAAAMDSGTAALTGFTALTLARIAARRREPGGRRLGAAALAWTTAALAVESLLSLALFLSYSLGAPADLAFHPALRLPARAPLFAGAAVLAWLVARRRR
jgi:hypothetical protein